MLSQHYEDRTEDCNGRDQEDKNSDIEIPNKRTVVRRVEHCFAHCTLSIRRAASCEQ